MAQEDHIYQGFEHINDYIDDYAINNFNKDYTLAVPHIMTAVDNDETRLEFCLKTATKSNENDELGETVVVEAIGYVNGKGPEVLCDWDQNKDVQIGSVGKIEEFYNEHMSSGYVDRYEEDFIDNLHGDKDLMIKSMTDVSVETKESLPNSYTQEGNDVDLKGHNSGFIPLEDRIGYPNGTERYSKESITEIRDKMGKKEFGLVAGHDTTTYDPEHTFVKEFTPEEFYQNSNVSIGIAKESSNLSPKIEEKDVESVRVIIQSPKETIEKEGNPRSLSLPGQETGRYLVTDDSGKSNVINNLVTLEVKLKGEEIPYRAVWLSDDVGQIIGRPISAYNHELKVSLEDGMSNDKTKEPNAIIAPNGRGIINESSFNLVLPIDFKSQTQEDPEAHRQSVIDAFKDTQNDPKTYQIRDEFCNDLLQRFDNNRAHVLGQYDEAVQTKDQLESLKNKIEFVREFRASTLQDSRMELTEYAKGILDTVKDLSDNQKIKEESLAKEGKTFSDDPDYKSTLGERNIPKETKEAIVSYLEKYVDYLKQDASLDIQVFSEASKEISDLLEPLNPYKNLGNIVESEDKTNLQEAVPDKIAQVMQNLIEDTNKASSLDYDKINAGKTIIMSSIGTVVGGKDNGDTEEKLDDEIRSFVNDYNEKTDDPFEKIHVKEDPHDGKVIGIYSAAGQRLTTISPDENTHEDLKKDYLLTPKYDPDEITIDALAERFEEKVIPIVTSKDGSGSFYDTSVYKEYEESQINGKKVESLGSDFKTKYQYGYQKIEKDGDETTKDFKRNNNSVKDNPQGDLIDRMHGLYESYNFSLPKIVEELWHKIENKFDAEPNKTDPADLNRDAISHMFDDVVKEIKPEADLRIESIVENDVDRMSSDRRLEMFSEEISPTEEFADITKQLPGDFKVYSKDEGDLNFDQDTNKDDAVTKRAENSSGVYIVSFDDNHELTKVETYERNDSKDPDVKLKTKVKEEIFKNGLKQSEVIQTSYGHIDREYEDGLPVKNSFYDKEDHLNKEVIYDNKEKIKETEYDNDGNIVKETYYNDGEPVENLQDIEDESTTDDDPVVSNDRSDEFRKYSAKSHGVGTASKVNIDKKPEIASWKEREVLLSAVEQAGGDSSKFDRDMAGRYSESPASSIDNEKGETFYGKLSSDIKEVAKQCGCDMDKFEKSYESNKTSVMNEIEKQAERIKDRVEVLDKYDGIPFRLLSSHTGYQFNKMKVDSSVRDGQNLGMKIGNGEFIEKGVTVADSFSNALSFLHSNIYDTAIISVAAHITSNVSKQEDRFEKANDASKQVESEKKNEISERKTDITSEQKEEVATKSADTNTEKGSGFLDEVKQLRNEIKEGIKDYITSSQELHIVDPVSQSLWETVDQLFSREEDLSDPDKITNEKDEDKTDRLSKEDQEKEDRILSDQDNIEQNDPDQTEDDETKDLEQDTKEEDPTDQDAPTKENEDEDPDKLSKEDQPDKEPDPDENDDPKDFKEDLDNSDEEWKKTAAGSDADEDDRRDFENSNDNKDVEQADSVDKDEDDGNEPDDPVIRDGIQNEEEETKTDAVAYGDELEEAYHTDHSRNDTEKEEPDQDDLMQREEEPSDSEPVTTDDQKSDESKDTMEKAEDIGEDVIANDESDDPELRDYQSDFEDICDSIRDFAMDIKDDMETLSGKISDFMSDLLTDESVADSDAVLSFCSDLLQDTINDLITTINDAFSNDDNTDHTDQIDSFQNVSDLIGELDSTKLDTGDTMENLMTTTEDLGVEIDMEPNLVDAYDGEDLFQYDDGVSADDLTSESSIDDTTQEIEDMYDDIFNDFENDLDNPEIDQGMDDTYMDLDADDGMQDVDMFNEQTQNIDTSNDLPDTSTNDPTTTDTGVENTATDGVEDTSLDETSALETYNIINSVL